MNLFLDGLFVIGKNWLPVSMVLTSIIGLGELSWFYLGGILNRYSGIRIPFDIVVGTILLVLASYFAVIICNLFNYTIQGIFYFIVIFSLVIIVISIRITFKGICNKSNYLTFIGIITLILILIIRMALLKYALFPSYADSVIHYEIIHDFLYPESNPHAYYSLENLTRNYYHLGFHSITAWLATISNLSIETSILFIGQFFLVVASFSVFAFCLITTGNVFIGLVAAFLVVFGWQMPAFAVNWGKYPALAGLAVFPMITGCMHIASQSKFSKKFLFWFLILSLGAILLHSRILVCIIMWITICFITRGDYLFKKSRIRTILLAGIVVIGIGLFLSNEVFFLTYSRWNSVNLIFLLILIPLAIWTYPKLTIQLFLFFDRHHPCWKDAISQS